MHTPLVVGVLAMCSMMLLLNAVFFLRGWGVRRSDREYLYFGLLTVCAGVECAIIALIYCRTLGIITFSEQVLFAALAIPPKPGFVLMFHFALRYARVRRSGAIAAPVYALMAAYVVLVLTGGWWERVGPPQLFTAFDVTFHRHDLVPTAATIPYFAVMPFILVAVCALVFRHWWRQREGLAACVGAALLGACFIHDVAAGAQWISSIPLFEIGYLAFSYGVTLTLVQRYAGAAAELQQHTSQLARRSGELFESYAELRRTQQELVRSEQLAVVGELAAVIAHEVRNPLAIVGNAVASLRKRHTTRDDRRTLVEIINEEMGRLDKLVGRLLNYARPVVPVRVDIALEDLVARSLAVAQSSEMPVRIVASKVPPVVSGDPDLLRQAFENIISNAVQACVHRRNGELVVRFERGHVDGMPAVGISFADDGEGMTPDACRQALSPFFTTRPTGTGLGLPIVARIVRAHGGRVEIASEQGVGTTVTLILPERRVVRRARAQPSRRPLLS